MSSLIFQENDRSCTSCPVKKTPREARPLSGATEALQQFLRENSPPAASLPSEIKRLSRTPLRHSRSKAFFNGLVRSKPPPHESSTRSHITSGSLLPHNCILLRQTIPGQSQQYYRIVRNSYHFDSLETRSMFKVNYEFRHHDVDKISDRKQIIRKRTVDSSSRQTKSPRAHSISTSIKPRFRLRPRKVLKDASKTRSLGGQKSTCSQDEEERRGRLPTRSACVPSKVHEVDGDSNSQAHKISLRNHNLDDLPQIGDLPAGKAFPASDLIRSIKSIRSSPGQFQSARSKKGFSPKGNINLRNGRNGQSALPAWILQNSSVKPHSAGRPNSVPSSPAQYSKQLASPVKLSVQKHLRQNVLGRPMPLMKDLAPMALTSNPPKPSASVLLNSPTHFEIPITYGEATTPGSGVSYSKSPGQRDSMTSFSIGYERVLNTIEPSTPVKKIASLSIKIGSPTTPPPRTPLPPVPRISPTKLSGLHGCVHQSDRSQGASQNIRDIPAKSPARIVRTINAIEHTNDQVETPQRSNIRPASFKNIHPCDRVSQEAQTNLQSHCKLRTPDLSSVEWPKPPKTHSDPEEPQPINVCLPTWEKQKDDGLRNRLEKTDSLKRRHLQSTPQRHPGTRGNRGTSAILRAPLEAVTELPTQQEGLSKSTFIVRVNSPTEPERAEPDTSYANLQKTPNLTFSGVKTDAIIKPLPIFVSKYHQKPPSRTVYRSHSTQMTPGKHEVILESESSMSNDESILIHGQYPADMFSDSDQREDSSDGEPRLPATQNKKLEIAQSGQWNGLVEVVFNQMDRMMASLEERLSKKLSEEIAKRTVSLEEKMRLVELAKFQFIDE